MSLVCVSAAHGACTDWRQHWVDGECLDNGILADIHTDGYHSARICKLCVSFVQFTCPTFSCSYLKVNTIVTVCKLQFHQELCHPPSPIGLLTTLCWDHTKALTMLAMLARSMVSAVTSSKRSCIPTHARWLSNHSQPPSFDHSVAWCI